MERCSSSISSASNEFNSSNISLELYPAAIIAATIDPALVPASLLNR